jgi:hypothetical protein
LKSPAAVTRLQLLRKQTITGTSTALITKERKKARTTKKHTNLRSLPTCDVSLGSLTLPAPEVGNFVQLILLFLRKSNLKNNRSAFIKVLFIHQLMH